MTRKGPKAKDKANGSVSIVLVFIARRSPLRKYKQTSHASSENASNDDAKPAPKAADTTPEDESQSSSDGSNAPPPPRSAFQQKTDEFLQDFKVQISLRVLYILFSTYGMYAMIREHPTRIFQGWNTVLISLGFLLNALLALVCSNRDVKISWVFIRSVTSWRFFWALVSIYPQHCLRAGIIGSTAALYSYYFTFDRKASIALISSLALVLSDTPALRKIIWQGEHKATIQVTLAFLLIVFLAGWKLYRWFALVGIFFLNDMLLTTEFHPNIGKGERIQTWVASAGMPMLLVYHYACPTGLPSYASPVYLVFTLPFIRAYSPNDGTTLVRTGFAISMAIALELFLTGISAKTVLLVLGLIVYLLVTQFEG